MTHTIKQTIDAAKFNAEFGIKKLIEEFIENTGLEPDYVELDYLNVKTTDDDSKINLINKVSLRISI